MKCDASFNKDGFNFIVPPKCSFEKAAKASGEIVSAQGDGNNFNLTGSIVMGFGRKANDDNTGVNMDVSNNF